MIPQTLYDPDPRANVPQHETINDLPVHSATLQQIFYPTSESRQFTRADAAKVFDEHLLPADERVPHPELIHSARETLAGVLSNQRRENATARAEAVMQKKMAYEQYKRLKEERSTKVVATGGRWDFKFREVSVDDAGATGRGPRGTGWRYGVPHMDRKRGTIKIPTSVA